MAISKILQVHGQGKKVAPGKKGQLCELIFQRVTMWITECEFQPKTFDLSIISNLDHGSYIYIHKEYFRMGLHLAPVFQEKFKRFHLFTL